MLPSGARVDALDRAKLTPLEIALHGCGNVQIVSMAELAAVMPAAGAATTARMAEFVTQIGTIFEFHRGGFNLEFVDRTSAALTGYVRCSTCPSA